MADFQLPEQLFHEKHYRSRGNSVRFAATSSMRETLCEMQKHHEKNTLPYFSFVAFFGVFSKKSTVN